MVWLTPRLEGKKHREWIAIATEPKTPSSVASSILMKEVLLGLLWETEEKCYIHCHTQSAECEHNFCLP